MKRHAPYAVFALLALAVACVGDEPAVGSASNDSGPPKETGPLIDPVASSSSSSSSSGSVDAAADAVPDGSPEPTDPRCEKTVPLGAGSDNVKCGAAFSSGTSIPLVLSRYEFSSVHNGSATGAGCAPIEVWRATLDVAPEGADWIFYLSIEVAGVRFDYRFKVVESGTGNDRMIVGTALCGSSVPLYEESDAGAGARWTKLSFIETEAAAQLLRFVIRHPISGEFRNLTFKRL